MWVWVRVLGFKVNVFPAWSANPCCSLSWVLLVQEKIRTEIEWTGLAPAPALWLERVLTTQVVWVGVAPDRSLDRGPERRG